MPRRFAVSLRLPAGIIICLAAALWGAGAFQQPDLGAFIGLVRDHISPRNEASEAPAGAGAAPSPVAAMGSSLVSAAAAVPPNAASADVAMPEPVAPGATPSPGSAPEPAPLPVADGPRNEASEAPAGAGAAPSPVAAVGSSVSKAAVPPSVASAGKTMPEPAANSADQPGATPSPGSLPEPAPQPVTVGPRLSASEIAALMVRGDSFLAAGDIASARLFFERAADSGDGRAAMRMAMTFDAAFLERAGVHGLRSDPERAAFWYQRARDLGAVKAEHAVTPSSEPSQRR